MRLKICISSTGSPGGATDSGPGAKTLQLASGVVARIHEKIQVKHLALSNVAVLSLGGAIGPPGSFKN